MALYATNRFPGDGSTTSYEFNFVGKYIARTHVKVYQEDNATKVRTSVPINDSNFLNDTTLRSLPVTPVGSTLVIYRDTPKPPLVDFVNGSRFTEYNLDLVARQGLFVAMEALDAGGSDARQQLLDAIAVVVGLVDDATAAVSDATAAALAAATSAANAASAATLAQSAKTAAEAANTAAQGAKTDAVAAASAAAGSAAAASTSASNAASSASAASTQAGLAGGYAVSANTQATNAVNSATAAANSATSASQSQTAAANSATSASQSQAAAANSATSASQSQAAAAASAALAASYVDPVNPNWNNPKVDTLNGGALAGFRNVIINGDMKVRQRTASSVTLPNGGIPAFTADRWRASKQGNHTVIFEHVPTGNGGGRARDCIRLSSTTAYENLPDNCTLVEQRVEGFEAIRFRGVPFTLSFLAKATRTGTYTVAFRNSAGFRSYLATYTITASAVWQPVIITVPDGIPVGDVDGAGNLQWDVTNGIGLQISWIVNGGSTHTSSLVNQWISDGKAVAQGQTQGLQANGDTFSITEVQLEVGTKRTPFERRHMSVEVALCKRYFEVVSIAGGTRGGEVGSLFIAHTPYAVQKRGASVLTARPPNLNQLTQPPTFAEVAPIGAYAILRSSSTNEFYYFGLVEAASEL